MEKGDLGSRRDVVPIDCLITYDVGQSVGHGQRGNEVVNASVL
jgi:hypothetical protein